MNLTTRPRPTGWLFAILFASAFVFACSKPPVQLTATLEFGLPAEMDADAVGDLDWYMLTSNNLEAAEVVPFDQRSGADSIKAVSATMSGKKRMIYSGVTQYKWTTGETYAEITEIAPGLQIQGGDEGSGGQISIEVDLPKGANRIVVHGGSSKGKPVVTGRIDDLQVRTVVEHEADQPATWAYELSFENAANKTAYITVSSSIEPEFTSSITVASVFVSSKAVGN